VLKKGYYELDLTILSDKPQETKEGEITLLFCQEA